MNEQEAARTLVKSAPELWAACSDPDTLSRHLKVFGEIKITRLEPETTVAWEGESASGTVVLEPSGWGTRVTLTASGEPVATPEPVSEPVPTPLAEEPAPTPVAEEPVPTPEPVAPDPVAVAPEPVVAPPRPGFFARLMGRGSVAAVPAPVAPPVPVEPVVVIQPEPEPVIEPEPGPEPVSEPVAEAAPAPAPVIDALAALEAALDSLGQAHHRPYSLT
jgi:hypothetical protein